MSVQRSARTVLELVETTWESEGKAPGPVVTGLQLRLGVGCLALLVLFSVEVGAGQERFGPLTGPVALAIAVGAAALPTSPLPTMLALLAGLMVLDAPVPLWLLLPVGALVHAVHVGASWSAVVEPRAQLELRALLPSVRRWAVTQALLVPVVAVLAAGPWLRALGSTGPLRGTSSALAGAVLAGLGVLLVVLTVVVVRRRGPVPPTGPPAS